MGDHWWGSFDTKSASCALLFQIRIVFWMFVISEMNSNRNKESSFVQWLNDENGQKKKKNIFHSFNFHYYFLCWWVRWWWLKDRVIQTYGRTVYTRCSLYLCISVFESWRGRKALRHMTLSFARVPMMFFMISFVFSYLFSYNMKYYSFERHMIVR